MLQGEIMHEANSEGFWYYGLSGIWVVYSIFSCGLDAQLLRNLSARRVLDLNLAFYL